VLPQLEVKMASLKVTVEADSTAAPGAVYEFLTDPSKMSQWVNGVTDGEWAAGAGPAPGGRMLLKYTYRNKVNDITMEVTAADPGHRFAHHTVEGPYPIKVHFALSPSGSGTRIAFTQEAISDSAATAFMFAVFGFALRPMVRKVLRKDLQKLTALAAGEPVPAR
jgi:uncharacterized protein YndB with AHSA1/START domain